MALARTPIRSSVAIGRRCVRAISSSRRDQAAEDVLDLLKMSTPTHKHPSSSQPQKSSKFSALQLARRNLSPTKDREREVREQARVENYTKQMYRRWNAGDVYAPHDLSGPEQKKWKVGRTTPQSDAFDVLGINPISEYKNYTMMSEFMTEMGRIKHSKQTGLRPGNQRKIAKAIRRAIGLGLMPSVHRHPLVLKKSSPTRFL